jgi:hypothetical protein
VRAAQATRRSDPKLPDNLAEFLPRLTPCRLPALPPSAAGTAPRTPTPAQLRRVQHERQQTTGAVTAAAASRPVETAGSTRRDVGCGQVPGSRAPGSVAGPVLFARPRSSMAVGGGYNESSNSTPATPTATGTPRTNGYEHAAQPPAEPADASTPINFDDPHYRRQPPSPGSAAETHRSSDAPGSFMLQLTATRRTRADLAYTNHAEAVSGGAPYRSHCDEWVGHTMRSVPVLMLTELITAVA